MNTKDKILYSNFVSRFVVCTTFIATIVCMCVLVAIYAAVSIVGRLIEYMMKGCALLVWKSIKLGITSKCKLLNMSDEETNDVISDINDVLYSCYTHIINNPTDIIDKEWFDAVEMRLDEIMTRINSHKK